MFEGESRAIPSAVEEKDRCGRRAKGRTRPLRGECYTTGRPHRWTYRLEILMAQNFCFETIDPHTKDYEMPIGKFAKTFAHHALIDL
jgi:hypothetical protein